MAFDGITVAAVVSQLKNELLNGRINKIAQPETDELLLTIKTPNGQKRLAISASASLPLIYLTDQNKPSPMTAPNFCMLLRKYIGNGRIIGITQPGLERIIRFEIQHLDELGDICTKYLIVEIMGKHSNIIFCRDDNCILDAIKHVPAHMSSIREVLPGREYFIPDTMHKLNPLTTTEDVFLTTLREKKIMLQKALYTTFTGISPAAAVSICEIAGLDAGMNTEEVDDDTLRHLYRQFSICMEDIQNGEFSPCIYYKGNEPFEFSSLPLHQYEGFTVKEFSSISEVLVDYYKSRDMVTRIRQKSTDLRHVVQTALDRNRKKFALQSKQLKDTEGRDKYKVYGELINVYGYDLIPGAKHLEALNYYTNETVKIPLDDTKTPQENSQRYFEKYNKQKRTFEALSELIQETEDDIKYLESITNALEIAQTEDDLMQIRDELAETGFIKKRFSKKKKSSKSKPFHYISSDGFDIYIGKNNLQNEELTFHFANGGDWWFHAKKMPGSHVIVKTNGQELPDRTFEEAGRLAAYYSSGRGTEKIEVDYIQRKHVKKPNGSKPGFVVYYTNYSLIIDSDISGIKEV